MNNPEYLNQHPDAIQDAMRAHAIALAGDEERTLAAQYRTTAELLDASAESGYSHLENQYRIKQAELLERVVDRIGTESFGADQAIHEVDRILNTDDQIISKPYDLQAGFYALYLMSDYSNGPSFRETAQQLEDYAGYHDRLADNYETEAANE